MRLILKNIAENLPIFIGKPLSGIPYFLKLGVKYYSYKNEVRRFEESVSRDKERYIVEHFRKIFEISKKNPFYNSKYKKAGVLDLEINSLEDITKVPVVTKEEIRENITNFQGSYRVNTGGSTGEPLTLYLDKQAWCREWAHMHYIWKSVDYSSSKTKITFRGKNLGKIFSKFNTVHNEYIINTYLDPTEHIQEFISILKAVGKTFLHGYPSAIYGFLKAVEKKLSDDEKRLIINNVEYCLFGSEYPTEQIIVYLKSFWDIGFISWYGHSEMCVLAGADINCRNYHPLHSYGYVEAVDGRLIGTSYHNTAMPLIRYDTGDKIIPEYSETRMLTSFTISEGRIGDYIIDSDGNNISLTALIFGRHHRLFDLVDYIQVYQDKPGKATLLIATKNDLKLPPQNYMDLSELNCSFEFIILKSPILSASGKVNLKVLTLP